VPTPKRGVAGRAQHRPRAGEPWLEERQRRWLPACRTRGCRGPARSAAKARGRNLRAPLR
jgi:hypothetical protein